MNVELPDGTVIEDVPEGTTKAQLAVKLRANGMEVPSDWLPAQQKPAAWSDVPAAAWQQTKDLLGGATRGAGSIGATLMAPHDALTQYLLERKGVQSGNLNEQRRQDVTAATRMLGADPESMTYGAGKLGAEIAGTAGVGQAIAPVAQALRAPAPLVNAIRTAGMQGGNMLPRVAGGAITGGAAAGLADPSQAVAGAMIGGALPPAVKVAGEVGKAVGGAIRGGTSNLLGLTTGVGAEPIRQAFKAGATGNKGFVANMRGDVPLTDVLDDAKRGLEAMRAAKSAQYRSGMVPIRGDQSVLQFADIDKAIQDATNVATFKGQVKNERASAAIEKMREAVDEWKSLDPTQFHTPEGLDALKQKLAGILEGIPYQERAARLAAGKVHAAAKETINRQAPTYAKVMKDYQQASDQIQEIERALSLGNKASADTAMRKLQSLMRNNVQTNYGNRLALAETLEQAGGVELLPEIAGQALNSWTPRSLAGQVGSGATMLGSAMTGNPLMLAALPFQSPRLMGNAAYQAGRMFGGSPAMSAAGPSFEQLSYQAAPVTLAPLWGSLVGAR